VPLAVSLNALEYLITREGLWSWGRMSQWRRGRAIFASDVTGVQRCQGIINFLWIENALGTPIFQDLHFLSYEGKRGRKKGGEGTHLLRTHKIWETYATLRNDKFDDFTQVPANVVDVERAVWLHTLAQSTRA
jgi:hypothetical protein